MASALLRSMLHHRRGPWRVTRDARQVDQAGGLSASGGVAGGARGHAGTSTRGAGAPVRDPDQGPPSSESSSRFDLDHPGPDVGER